MVNNKIVLITGGTGSFGKAFVKKILDDYNPKAIRILSRDELKQWEMQQQFSAYRKFKKLRFFIGDVRDADRLKRAFEDVDIVIHAAALKQVPAAEYNPSECIKTNILGAENVISASLDSGVKKVIALSTDKASSPVNLYGATKLCSDKLFIAANNMVGSRKIAFSVVRYGNVIGSRGSVVPFFIKQRESGILTLTHKEMTRFNLTLDEAGTFVINALKQMKGGELFVPKLPSYRLIDLAEAISPSAKKKIVGMRPGEKIHEEMVPVTESLNTVDFGKFYAILPKNPEWDKDFYIKKYSGKKVKEGFSYNSGDNDKFLTVRRLRKIIKQNIDSGFEPT